MRRKVGEQEAAKEVVADTTQPSVEVEGNQDVGEKDQILVECEELKEIVDRAYRESVLIDEAEKLAARFLSAQMLIADELRRADLDARMRKNGVKTLKAAIWYEAATKEDKKPSDKQLDALVERDSLVSKEQKAFDQADVYCECLNNYLNIFKDAHIYFRGISRGRYE